MSMVMGEDQLGMYSLCDSVMDLVCLVGEEEERRESNMT